MGMTEGLCFNWPHQPPACDQKLCPYAPERRVPDMLLQRVCPQHGIRDQDGWNTGLGEERCNAIVGYTPRNIPLLCNRVCAPRGTKFCLCGREALYSVGGRCWCGRWRCLLVAWRRNWPMIRDYIRPRRL